MRVPSLRSHLTLLSLVGALCLPLAATSAHADSPTPVDYFNAGAFTEAIYCWYYNIDLQDQLQEKYATGRQLFVKSGAPDALLKSLDAYEQSVLALPLTKDWNSWTQDQRDAFTKLDVDENAVGTWLGANNTLPRFFHDLGFWSLDFSYTLPTALAKGYTFAHELPNFTANLASFAALKTNNPDMYKMLSPDVQKAFEAIVAYKDKANDPLSGGLAPADATDMQTQANIINAAARAGTLVVQ